MSIQTKVSELERFETPAPHLPLISVEKKAKPDAVSISVVFGVLSVFAFRAFLTARVPLMGDEAYYWLWAKHLALGYHDHPPLVGWLIALSGSISDTTFWIRLPALICSGFSAFFFYRAASEILESRQKAGVALLLFLLVPLMAVASLAVFPDMGLILGWTAALWAGWKALSDERYWLIAGAAVGLAILSKLLGLFLLPSFALFFLLDKRSRGLFRSRYFWGGIALAALISIPFWIWNARHGFENVVFQFQDHISGQRPNPIRSFFGYLGVQSLNISPILFFLLIPTIAGLIRGCREGDRRSNYLIAFAAPIHAVFFFLPFFARVGFHWALPGYISLFIAPAQRNDFKRATRIGLALAAAMTLLFYSVLAFPEKFALFLSPVANHFPKWRIRSFFAGKGYGEILGYRDLAKAVGDRRVELKRQDPFLMTGSYTLSSDLWYYSGIQVRTALFSGQGGEYSRWNRFQNLRGRNALWVDLAPFRDEPAVSLALSGAFAQIGNTQEIEIRQGDVKRIFYLTELRDLRNPSALPSNPDPRASPTGSSF